MGWWNPAEKTHRNPIEKPVVVFDLRPTVHIWSSLCWFLMIYT
jgi:hypothetical protein